MVMLKQLKKSMRQQDTGTNNGAKQNTCFLKQNAKRNT